jgi:hypothetical protein
MGLDMKDRNKVCREIHRRYVPLRPACPEAGFSVRCRAHRHQKAGGKGVR